MMSINNRRPQTASHLRPPLWTGHFELGRFVLAVSLKHGTDDGRAPLAIENRLASLRQEQGFSRVAVADQLHIHPSTLLALEEGRYLPGLRLAMELSTFFHMPIEALFCTTSEENQG